MIENILIRSVNWIGDAVMTLPSIRLLRKIFRDSKISLLLKPTVRAVFEGDPDIDEIILYEDRHRGAFGRLRLAAELRKRNFLKAILFQNAFDAALITFLARIPERIGYSRDGRGLLLTKPIPFNNDGTIHHIDYYLNLVHQIAGNIEMDNLPPYIFLMIRERLDIRLRLQGLRRPILGINPGATYGYTKRWLPERFAEVAEWFIKDSGGSVIITGSESERLIADEIVKAMNPEFRSSGHLLNLAGNTSLRELIALISECDLYLSNDSGPMHLAYAVGTPLVALFGSTDPELTGPVGEGSKVIKAEVECSPCFKRSCEIDRACMYSIKSDDVYLALKSFFPTKKAVFFDRDGTLCEDVNYLRRWKDFKVFDDISEVKLLKDKGFLLIGVTNQSGIKRGLVGEAFVKEVNRVFIDQYKFDDFLYCPHHPLDHCSCRKPELGMIHIARARHGIDLKGSYVIGDKDEDMLLAKAAGAKGILVRTGKERVSSNAFIVANNIREAVGFIVEDTHH